jgi:4-carboxymuconolactone decarboxylase
MRAMATHPSTPRLAPLRADELSDEQRTLLSVMPLPINIFSTLVRHPGLFRRWAPFGGKLLGGKLPARAREIVILRTAWRCGAAYEWGQHVAIARDAGLSADEIRAVANEGASAPGWPPAEAALLRAVDELVDDHCISDATWAALAAEFDDERQLIEVPMLSGHYAMLAGMLNSLGVQPDRSDLPALGEA